VLAVGLVALFRRFDAPRDTAPRPGGDGLAAAGAALAVFGVLMVSAVGVDVLSMATARFIAVDITPLTAVTVLAAALAVLAVRPRSGTR
jgi:hypothetical protein